MDHRAEVARTLRVRHGFGYKRIAKILGSNRDQVRSWLRVTDGRRLRGDPRWRYYPNQCETCGTPSSGKVCESCKAVRKFNRCSGLYLAGLTYAEIGSIIGSTANRVGSHIQRMRAEGWSMPNRWLGRRHRLEKSASLQ